MPKRRDTIAIARIEAAPLRLIRQAIRRQADLERAHVAARRREARFQRRERLELAAERDFALVRERSARARVQAHRRARRVRAEREAVEAVNMVRFRPYTDSTRPPAAMVGAGAAIYNSTDNGINVSDGTNWRSPTWSVT